MLRCDLQRPIVCKQKSQLPVFRRPGVQRHDVMLLFEPHRLDSRWVSTVLNVLRGNNCLELVMEPIRFRFPSPHRHFLPISLLYR